MAKKKTAVEVSKGMDIQETSITLSKDEMISTQALLSNSIEDFAVSMALNPGFQGEQNATDACYVLDNMLSVFDKLNEVTNLGKEFGMVDDKTVRHLQRLLHIERDGE